MRILANALVCSMPYMIIWCVGRSVNLRQRCAHGQPVDRIRERWLWFLVMYLILLIQITVFRYGLQWVPLDVPRTTNGQPLVTLALLRPWALFYNVVGNIAWFVPLGMALPQVSSRLKHLWQALVIGLLLSCTIEGLQYLFYTGISDIDDIIFNTIGAGVGWVLALLSGKIAKLLKKNH